MIKYLFPYDRVEKDSDIILYAAGNVGKDYYYQISESGYCHIKAWVDKGFESYVASKMPVENPRVIHELRYDYIVVAVANEKRFMSIKEELCSRGVGEHTIVWGRPTSLCTDSGFFIDHDLPIARDATKMMEELPAKDIISSERMDIIIRYLYARDILAGINPEGHKNLYSRFILTVNGAEEPLGVGTFQDQFTGYSNKKGIKAFTDDFGHLLELMQKEGFYKEKAIPLNREGSLLNGSHRLACALALEKKIWADYYDTSQRQDYWTAERLAKTGFLVSDQIDVMRGFSDLYEACGILLLFGEVEEIWEYARKSILHGFRIVGYATIDMEDDFIAWDNLMCDISGRENRMTAMIHRMQVVLYSDEENRGQDIFELPKKRMSELKDVMRLSDKDMLLSENRGEYLRLRKLLLSVNNLQKLGMRLRSVPKGMLCSRVNALRACVEEQGVDWNNICLTDEAVMEVLGLREAGTIKVLISRDNKKKLCLPEGFEREKQYNEAFCRIDQHHFIWLDTKILNPEIVMEAMLGRMDFWSSTQEGLENSGEYIRDCRDYRYLQLLFDHCACFRHDRSLKRKMDIAIQRQYGRDTWFKVREDE